MEVILLDREGASTIHTTWARGEPVDIMGRLLIVDDEPDYLDELAEALEFVGVASVNVSRAAAALEAVRGDPQIHMVLTDIRMPDMDGVTLIEALRATFPERHLTFIVMTGHAAEVDVRRAEAAGAAACFSKPLDFEALCAAIATMEAAHEQQS